MLLSALVPGGTQSAATAALPEDAWNVELVGHYDTPGSPLEVALAGGVAYVADYVALLVVDVSDPASPAEVGSYDPPGIVAGVAVAGECAYVANHTEGMRVVDVSDPAAPTEVGFVDTPGLAMDVAVAETYAYVADRYSGLRAVDVSNPAQPVEVGFYDTPGAAYSVAVVGQYAYVADTEGGLRVVDVSDPAAPIEVGFSASYAVGVAVSGSYAYVVGGSQLMVVDVSNPASPVEVGHCGLEGNAQDVAVGGGHVYVAAYGAGLRVVDVSDPAAPTEVGFYDTAAGPEGVAFAGGYAYLGADADGLLILHYTGGMACPSTIRSAKAGVWNDPATWDLNRAPESSDVVQIAAGHTVTAPAQVTLRGLCNSGILRSAAGHSLRLDASEFITNDGQILGQSGDVGTGSACGAPGGDLELRGSVPIENWGTIRAGDGGAGERCGGPGGSVIIYGRNTTNTGTICAGKGGDVLGILPGAHGGEGGEALVYGKSGGPGFLINRGLTCGGDGGDGNPAAAGPQRGGNGGRLKLISLPDVILDGGIQRGGRGGRGTTGGPNGKAGPIIIEPNTISLSGMGTELHGSSVTVFGGEEWTLDLSLLNTMTITATDSITLAVGSGGVIDLRGNAQPVMEAEGQVYIASDAILLDEGVELQDLVLGEVARGSSQILSDVSLVGPGVAWAEPGVTFVISLTVLNGGPLGDTYALSASDTAGWVLGGVSPLVAVEGLEGLGIALEVTPPPDAVRGDIDEITVTAQSQGLPGLVAIRRIQVVVVPSSRIHLPLVLRSH